MKKKLASIFALVLCAAILLSGCGGGTGGGNSGGGGSSTTAPDTTGDSNTPETTEGGDTFTFAIVNDPDSLDPGWTDNTFATPIFSNMSEGLVRYDLDSNLVPGAAEEWDISEDGMVYTFTIRSDAKWSDGTDLTAYDFEYAWKRVLDPEFASRASNKMYPYIKNAEKYFKGEAAIEDVGIVAIDDKTLEITLETPTSFILSIMATWTYYPVNQAVVSENPDWTKNPDTYISNGPFKLVKYNLGDELILEKNEYYWDADAVSLGRIVFKFIPELSTALSAFESGAVDGIKEVPSSEVPRLRSDVSFTPVPTFSTSYYLINTQQEALNDPRVRKALSMALDRTEIIEDVLQASYSPAMGHVPPGYVTNGEDFREVGGYYDLGPTAKIEEAQALLAEAGYPNGEGFPELELGYYTNEVAKKVAESMQQMWKKNLNVDFKITSAEWSVFFVDVQNLDYGICAMGDLGTFLHPMAFLGTFPSEDPPLATGWANAEYDQLLKDIIAETDEAKATELMHRAEDIFMNDHVLIPTYHKNEQLMMQPYVKNWTMTATGYYLFDKIVIEK